MAPCRKSRLCWTVSGVPSTPEIFSVWRTRSEQKKWFAAAIRLRRIIRSSQNPPWGADRTVPFRKFGRTVDAVRELKSKGYCVLAVEVSDQSQHVWDYDCRFPLALVFGNEALGVDSGGRRGCDGIQFPCRCSAQRLRSTLAIARLRCYIPSLKNISSGVRRNESRALREKFGIA